MQDIHAELAEGWNNLAEQNWRHAISGQSDVFYFEKHGLEYARTIANQIPQKTNNRLLEIGCGVGRIMRPLSSLCAEIHGVDISPLMVKMSKKYLKNHENCHTYLVKDESLQMFEPETFDFAYAIGCFIHCESDMTQKYVDRVRDLLISGCKFYFDVHALSTSADLKFAKTRANRIIHTSVQDAVNFKQGWSDGTIELVSSRFVCTLIK